MGTRSSHFGEKFQIPWIEAWESREEDEEKGRRNPGKNMKRRGIRERRIEEEEEEGGRVSDAKWEQGREGRGNNEKSKRSKRKK